MGKIKILCYCDSPTVATGFGTVSRNILAQLYTSGRYEIDIFGINYHGEPHTFPFRIWPASDYQVGDPYGRRKFCYFALQHDFDILWVLQDTFIVDFLPELIRHLKSNRVKPFRTIMYFPVDSVLREEWCANIEPVDKLVAYTEFGKQALLKHLPAKKDDIDVVYHGVDLNVFKPLDKDFVDSFRSSYFSVGKDRFIFMNINRNQQRKDIPRTIQAFKEFKKLVPESMLYLHMCPVDQGWNIPKLLVEMDMKLGRDVVLPEKMEPNQGYPLEIINNLYNSCDCVISTTLGEGFGIGWLESMACKTPTLMPDNTAMNELITSDRGYLVDSGSNTSLWTCLPNDNDILRPLVDVDDMVKKMCYIYDNYDEALNKAESAYKWVLSDMQWSGKIAKQWLEIFSKEVVKLHVSNERSSSSRSIKLEQL
jgi:glycosyltransferase involved in cell wall biosynthesis